MADNDSVIDPVIDPVIEELKGAIADAKAAAAAVQGAGSAAEDHLAAIRRNLDSFKNVMQRAEDAKTRLVARDKRNLARAQKFAAEIDAVAKDFEADGQMTSNAQTETRNSVKEALGLASLAEVDVLRGEVGKYDDKTQELVENAQTALDASLTDLSKKHDDLEEARKTLASVEGALDKHARNALRVHVAALADKEAVETAIKDSGQFRAVVHLNDLMTRRDRLKGAVKLDADDLRFDANDPTTASTALETKWDQARDAYRDKLVAYVTSEADVIGKRIALADAQAAAETRTASRLTDAAAAVEEIFGGLSNGGTATAATATAATATAETAAAVDNG